LVIAFAISIVAGRLIQLQGIDAPAYASEATQARLRTVDLPADRGSIVDTNGVTLATTIDTVAITADPTLTRKHAAAMAAIIAPYLHQSRTRIAELLQTPHTRFVYLAREIDPDIWTKIDNALTKAKLYGVYSQSDPSRIYPAGRTAAAILGFVDIDGNGQAGLERSQNSELAGIPGHTTYEVAADGPALPLGEDSTVEPKPGQTVELTLDQDLQYQAQKLVAAAVKRTGADSGDAIAMDARTGQILAMATAPTFNANDPTATKADLRRDRPISDEYEPGSVFKLLTVASVIDAGKATPETREKVPGYIYRDGSRIKDWWGHGTIKLTLAGAIARSSNIGTALAAEQLSNTTRERYLHKFGIAQPTGVGLPAENPGMLAPAKDWSSLDAATIAFGQGVSVNALQMVDAVQAIANGGERIAPQLIKGYRNADGTFIPAPAPTRTRVISPKTAKQVREIMEQVTNPTTGLAPKTGIPGYVTGGKTGTAQKANAKCGCYQNYTVSFAEIAPADAPRFVVYVDLQNVGGSASGGGDAGPVASQLLKLALQKYKVPPTGAKPVTLKQTW
jgi:cell division protein FtsI (penicillin-binding protein 3)